MPTIGHFIGILIPILLYLGLNKKISLEIELYFIAGSILPDTYTIIKIFIFPDIVKYIPLNITHGFIIWIMWSFIFAIIFYCIFHRISKLQFSQIFFVLLSAGWIHLGLDMLTQPVWIIGDFKLSILSFYTDFKILGEQDFIVIFYLIFLIIPLIILLIVIRKEEKYIKKYTKKEVQKNIEHVFKYSR